MGCKKRKKKKEKKKKEKRKKGKKKKRKKEKKKKRKKKKARKQIDLHILLFFDMFFKDVLFDSLPLYAISFSLTVCRKMSTLL